MSGMFRMVSVYLLAWAISTQSALAAESPPSMGEPTQLHWLGDYARAMETARREGKMMLIYFDERGSNELGERFESEALSDPAVVQKLGAAVLVKVATDASISVQGKDLLLLDHFAFARLEGRRGVAIVDYVHQDPGRHGVVVSTFPLTAGRREVMERLSIIPDRAANRPPEGKQQPAAEPPRPGAPSEAAGESERLPWYTDYAAATDVARRQRKMMFLHFVHPGPCEPCGKFVSQALSSPQVVQKLNRVVKVRLPVDATIAVEGRRMALLKQPAFSEMLGREGMAIIDFAHPDAEYYGQVVSTFPFLKRRPYTPEQTAAILDLPPGTLTQRTLIYAVRVHPERPASTQGKLDAYLLKEASLHSQHQARIRLQGHHQWNRRFHRINARLPRGLLASEVCAESWPGENLVEAAVECVRCWRLSSGHWRSVRAPHPVYAYDIKRGSNGIWYATGIFGGGS